ncbi:MAG: thioredoxin [Patescibacteria group bacterium]
MSELILTDQSFDQEVLQATVPVLVDFWAPWCGPCRVQGPILEELAKEIDVTKMKVVKLNVDDNSESAGRFNVLSIPTLMIFKGGQVVEQFVGVQSKEKLLEMLNKHI